MRHRLVRSLALLIFVTVSHVNDVAARYHHIKLRHERHRRQHADGYLPSSFVSETNEEERGSWGPWSAPSSCSRSCGGGVAHQTRQCLDVDDNGYERCTGSKKRFFSCNIQACPSGSTDFRAQQCAEYNNVEFEGVHYDWVPYTGGPNKCELNCMPKGERFFYRHAPHVTDGTLCDLEKNDVCVEGKCLPVGCDLMLGSDAKEDACRECNGDGSDCNTVKGIFDADDLQVGYIDTLLIPQGATNIVVKEIRPSNNYLAIRNTTGYYYLNGNWRIDFPRSLQFAGTLFHYERVPQGFSAPDVITALGPTTEPIYIVLLYQDKNVGVHYEYSIPKKFSQQGDPDSYTWVADEFSECSSSCGGGFKSRKVTCVRRRDNEPADEHLCDRQLEPVDTESCGTEPCPPEWVEGEWGPCSKQCGEGGERVREIKCEQLLAGGIPSIVEDSQCLSTVGPKNVTTEKCNENVDCPTWHIGPWKPCDHLCGTGKQTRRVTCYKKDQRTGKIEVLEDSACSNQPIPEREIPCEVRPCAGVDWMVSGWSGCDEKCGLTEETRTVHCATQDGKIYPDDKCDVETKPELSRKCDNPKGCDYLWYASQWSECSAQCGKGIKSRKVFCATFDVDETLKKVDGEKCDAAKKFNETEECESETKECTGEWFAGPWSKCSKPCGGGDTSRQVVCLKDGVVVAMKNCDYSTIMFSTDTCNDFTCGKDEIIPVEPTESKIPGDDEEEECEVYEDEEPNFVTLESRLDNEDSKVTHSGETSLHFDTDSSDWVSFDDMMQSDAPNRGDITLMTTDSEDGSGYGISNGEYTGDILSSIYTDKSVSTSVASTDEEGSGVFTNELSSVVDTLFTNEVTEIPTDEATGKSDSENETTESVETSATSRSISTSMASSGATEQTSDVSSTQSSVGISVSTVQTSTESSETTSSSDETSESTDSSASTDSSENTTDLSASTDSSESTSGVVTSSATGSTESATEVSSSTDLNTVSTISSATDSTEPTDSTVSTPSTEPTETTVTATSQSTPSDVTETTVSGETDGTTVALTTTTSGETTVGSEATTTVDISTTTQDITTATGFTIGDAQSESTTVSGSTDATTTESATEDSTTVASSTISSTTIETGSTDVLSTLETTTSATNGITETSTSPATTESGATTESAGTTEVGDTASTESPGTTESGGTTISGETTQSGATTESGATTVSGISTESSGSTTESVTVTIVSRLDGSGETDETTVSGPTTSSPETTTTDDWEDLTEQSHITDLWTTISPVDEAITREHKLRKCKIPKKKACKTSEFGCCYDGVTPAQGPFDKGCLTPRTCEETKYGCCPDGVSPATGQDNEGCPFSHCNETLFGCCPDEINIAEGNDFEGCPKPCNETEFGCCPDEETPASGKDNLGCCNTTIHGCCPDGIKPAIGDDLEGCEDEEMTTVTEMSSIEPETEAPGVSTTPSIEEDIFEEDCNNATHGCCPNGRTAATGPNFEGCGVIDEKNCTASYFGCCPDNESPALGPNNDGCGATCENTIYGCCPDRITPAHGPNREGCCLGSPHGCCPDDVTPARGPNFHGCGCQYSPFRCCPDNTTAARGPDNDGCGCQYTPHGCCPNKIDPANGPDFEGCHCRTYQFGCCSDGVTVATGPQNRGCGCENTKFKCCSDGKTPATGTNYAGCTCETSKYGCCLDGIEEAQGENFEGCDRVLTHPGESCGLQKDLGSCRNFTVKWFFDTVYGDCARFWYGGCAGNDNRFKSQEECKNVCVHPQGKDVCHLPKISGSCEGYHPSWYYDGEKKQCGQFVYSGCLGNGNRFETREECEDRCSVTTDIEPCDQPKESGPCEGNFMRWYFNKELQTCEIFRYGGCKPNENNYPTKEACHQQCLQPGQSRVINVRAENECGFAKDPGPCPGSLLRWYHDANLRACRQFVYGGCKGNGNKFRTRADCERRCSIIRDSCSEPRDEGTCMEKHAKWFFDRSENRCMPFYYTGCGGNRNNFDTRDVCEADCPAKIEQDTCLLPALLGECHNYTARWFWDSYAQRCRQFYYGGCGGNGNNFATEQDCSNRCEKTAPTAAPIQEFRTEFCLLPDERGPCTESIVKWFYDSREGVCKQFQFSGCAGNGNQFDTREECDYRCGNVQDPCAMPKVVGSCNDFVKQFYYDRRTDTCEEFEYSGCDGNKNRFADRSVCEHQCRRESESPRRNVSRVDVTPAPVAPTSPICLAPVDAGPCDGNVVSYYYDSVSKNCEAFIYGGCGGNANRFQTEEQCERLCGRFQGQDSCNLPVESGPCRGAFPKIYYDPNARACREFVYGGCDGNANRFSNVPECESLCLHHEEPAAAGNDTQTNEICREPVDSGPCPAGIYKRFYFDEDRQICMPFLYTGCGGNRNNFKTFESCINTCYKIINEIDVDTDSRSKNPCTEAREECDTIRCPYGKEAYVDDDDCERCRCADPCKKEFCPWGMRCSITLVATAEGIDYRGVCRSTTKFGNCPVVSNSTRCERECSDDADCNAAAKCCDNGCGTSCLEPAPEEPPTTLAPVFNVTAPPFGADAAAIKQPEEPRVSGEEGGFVTMTCIVTGNPRPAISWRKDATVILQSEKRIRILPDGSLQIVNLYVSDRGTYICTADNGLAPPARTEYQLEVTEPHERPAAIVGEPETYVTVTMNAPTILRCYAMGWPRPFVTWWRGDRMLPLSSEFYEQDSDYTLLIRSVTLTNLGVYTCQAYNGIQKPASWSITVQAIGPVVNIRPDQLEYAKYLVQPPKRPERPSTDRPRYPYRPSRTQAPANLTYAPIYQTPAPPRRRPSVPRPTSYPRVVPLTVAPPPIRPNRFQVPVSVNVSAERTEYPVGGDVNIGCAVDGYPSPRVLWYKDDEIVRTSERIQISALNRLVVHNATTNDSGNYRCEATNEYSSGSASLDIRVDSLYIHPDCQDNAFFANCDLIVKGKYCNHTYYAKFCCRSCTAAGLAAVAGGQRS